MDIREMIFNRNKYIRVTNGNEVLISIGGNADIEIEDTRTHAHEKIEHHDQCLAWALYRNDGSYEIKSYLGNPEYGGPGYFNSKLADRLTSFNDVYILAKNVIELGGVISLLSHIRRCLQSLLRNEVVACL